MNRLIQDLRIFKDTFSLAGKLSKKYLPLVFADAIVSAFAILPGILLPKFIINEILDSRNAKWIVSYVALLIAFTCIFRLLKAWFQKQLKVEVLSLEKKFLLYLSQHSMHMNYMFLEDAAVLNLKEQALFPIRTQNALHRMIDVFGKFMQAAVSIGALLIFIGTLHIAVVFILLAGILLNTFIFQKLQKAQFEWQKELTPINRQFGYLYGLTSDFTYGKDIRLYNMKDYVMGKMREFDNASLKSMKKLYRNLGGYEGLSSVNVQLAMLAVFAFGILQVHAGNIGIGDFSSYALGVVSFAKNITVCIRQFIELRTLCRYMEFYMQYLAIGAPIPSGTEKTDSKASYTIEFKDVWFCYPKAEKYVLKGINLTMEGGQSLSIVGENGAGKSTFVKLLCKLYQPNKGVILLNGKDIYSYGEEEYINLLSVIFQDFKLFDFGIDENIVAADHYEITKIDAAIEQSGLKNRLATLRDGIKTRVYSRFEDGVTFSGGELQKMAIARAIYKGGAIMVLDEPTAALDPYAEAEIYAHFYEMVKGKTTIFISHRLSSCRFCDHIAVFKDGKIVEYGTHESLLLNHSHYAAMWDTQSKYYQ